MEFKVRLTKNIAREMVAFANTDGGDIVIGVDDDGQMVGTVINNTTRSSLQDIASNCDPPIFLEVYEHIDKTDRQFFMIHVGSGDNKPYRCTVATTQDEEQARSRCLLMNWWR